MAVPSPGSRTARSQGCTCPVLVNLFGTGRYTPGGTGRELNPHHQLLPAEERRWFVFDVRCPLHGAGDWLDR